MITRNACARLVAAVAVMAMTAACGSSSHTPTGTESANAGGAGSSSSASASTSSSGSTAIKSPIVIGFANASTGAADGAQDAPNVGIANAWATWVNTQMGGINGHPVRLLIRDTQDNPATAARIAQELIQNHVVAEVGGADSATDAVWIKALAAAHIPTIGGGDQIDHTLIVSVPLYFPVIIDVLNYIPLIANEAKLAGAHSVGTVLCAESPTCAGAATLLKPQVLKLGLTDAGFVGVRGVSPITPPHAWRCKAPRRMQSGSPCPIPRR